MRPTLSMPCARRLPRWSSLAALYALFTVSSLAAAPVDFNRDIRPILSDNCFTCHGPDDRERKARLRLDRKEDALKRRSEDEYAILPGQPDKSLVYQRVIAEEPEDVMPPPKTGKKLTPQQVELLKRWIAEGATWQEHWAFVKPERAGPPEVKHDYWPRNEIDHFILAKLEKENLKPSPEADKTTLARRAALDLTGLPPTPQEVDALLNDSSPAAYEKLVDRLLDTPAYGEHMARYWMDAVRYADSHGYHIDSDRSMWKYREWVIDAFNQNMPYDRFTTEQLAGDLLTNATTSQKVASGYVRCNMSTGEGGAIEQEYQAKYTFDRTETTSTIWLGLTMTCARCHTHKYDPITQREYYRLYGFFNSIDEAIMDGNKPNPDPFLKLPTADQAKRQKELKQLIADGQKRAEAPLPEIDQAQAKWIEQWQQRLGSAWTITHPTQVKSLDTNGVEFRLLPDLSTLVEGHNPPSDVHEVLLQSAAGMISAFRLEALAHDALPKQGTARADDGAFRLSEFEAELLLPAGTNADRPTPKKLKLSQAAADSAVADRDAAKAIDGKAETGWQPDTANPAAPHTALFLLAEPVEVPPGAELLVRLRYEASKSKRAIGRFRLSVAQGEAIAQLFREGKRNPWHMVGPFKTEGLQHGFTNVYEPEQTVDLQKSFDGVREPIKWTARPDLEDGKKHLFVNELHGVHGAYYLYRVIPASSEQTLDVRLRADTLCKLWVNGQLVAERAEPEKLGEGPVKVTVPLKPGTNTFLVKVVNHQGACNFSYEQERVDLDAMPRELLVLLATPRKYTDAEQASLRQHFRKAKLPEYKKLVENMKQWREEEAALDKAIPTTMVAREMAKPRETVILERGEYDKPGEKVPPGVPAILPPFPVDAPTNRLGLARWLMDPAHPLTARVTVNRFWQQVFGVGLVKTTEDFGAQGEHPSHPELLDWLATEFIRSGWDVKHLVRLMVTSATYRQQSRIDPSLLARDPENRLLARGPRHRLDAEVVRDSALAISGLLVRTRGGPSAKPYEPPGLWEAVSFNNSQKYVPDTGEGQYRRSLYTYWKRQSPPPNMLLFDAPSREYCVVRRPRTNTPLQALAMMNDPQFVEASRAFGSRILREVNGSTRDRLRHAFRLATSRFPDADEMVVLLSVFQQQLEDFKKETAAAEKLLTVGSFPAPESMDKAELAAWTTIASLILNLDETITKG